MALACRGHMREKLRRAPRPRCVQHFAMSCAAGRKPRTSSKSVVKGGAGPHALSVQELTIDSTLPHSSLTLPTSQLNLPALAFLRTEPHLHQTFFMASFFLAPSKPHSPTPAVCHVVSCAVSCSGRRARSAPAAHQGWIPGRLKRDGHGSRFFTEDQKDT